MNDSKFRAALDAHRAAVVEFLSSAHATDEARWAVPNAEGKWSPGEIAEHLSISYDVLIDEMKGGPGMRIVTSWWQRLVLGVTILPKIMKSRTFPVGARAPREVRPATAAPKAEALARLQARSEAFEASIRDLAAKNPSARLTHAYFGKRKLADVVTFCEIHVSHHRKQLP